MKLILIAIISMAISLTLILLYFPKFESPPCPNEVHSTGTIPFQTYEIEGEDLYPYGYYVIVNDNGKISTDYYENKTLQECKNSRQINRKTRYESEKRDQDSVGGKYKYHMSECYKRG